MAPRPEGPAGAHAGLEARIARVADRAAPGERVSDDEYLLVVSYRVAFDAGSSGRYGPAELERLG